jgi:hypothetical protein
VTSAADSCRERPRDPPADAVAEGPITFKALRENICQGGTRGFPIVCPIVRMMWLLKPYQSRGDPASVSNAKNGCAALLLKQAGFPRPRNILGANCGRGGTDDTIHARSDFEGKESSASLGSAKLASTSLCPLPRHGPGSGDREGSGTQAGQRPH